MQKAPIPARGSLSIPRVAPQQDTSLKRNKTQYQNRNRKIWQSPNTQAPSLCPHRPCQTLCTQIPPWNKNMLGGAGFQVLIFLLWVYTGQPGEGWKGRPSQVGAEAAREAKQKSRDP